MFALKHLQTIGDLQNTRSFTQMKNLSSANPAQSLSIMVAVFLVTEDNMIQTKNSVNNVQEDSIVENKHFNNPGTFYRHKNMHNQEIIQDPRILGS